MLWQFTHYCIKLARIVSFCKCLEDTLSNCLAANYYAGQAVLGLQLQALFIQRINTTQQDRVYPCEDDPTDLQHRHVCFLTLALLPDYSTDAVL